LIFYKTLKYKGVNYSIIVGLSIMGSVFLIVVHKSTIDHRVFIFSYHILKFMSFVCTYIGIYYYNWEKSHESISQREKQIKLYAKKINSVVKKRTLEIENMNKRLNDDLEYARKIQQSLLPSKEINYSDVTFISNYYPCEKLSGDFYDIFRIDNKNIGMYILDVSGHGVSAAMLTMFCKNSIISGERLIRRYRGLKPHRNLQHFYAVFNEADFPSETHMVMFFASYNVDTHVLKYSSGGMNCNPIVLKKDGGIYELSENQGFPISKIGEFYTPEYSTSFAMLNKGDSVFFYTDGLTDYNKNKILDYNGLIRLLKEEKTVGRISKNLDEIIQKNSNKLEDDITYFMMEVK
ncbi:SpoIIE family protein phosphatase, partial [Clostridiaceae bacterium HSG29]|nr:SpoIIE family protein phosphatase [Clostridiaceae bacterium HSG29]